MTRIFALTLVVGLIGSPVHKESNQAEVRTMTGWFADAKCAGPRVAKGIIAPNNPECVKKCLDGGEAPVFISEQAKAMFEVRDYSTVKADVGYHVELKGRIEEAGKAIRVTAVKRLSYVGHFCAAPPKKARHH